jgi:DNA mismatch repair protein MutS
MVETPFMQQFLKAKAEHPDCLVLFRMGDFYETFFDDAKEAAVLLDIVLTSRNRDEANPIPMAGVPHHALASYLTRLLAAGRKVAICEQMEDPKLAKGLVRREVVRVVTPGVLLDTELVEPDRPNHLVCVRADDRGFAVAALDASTGVFLGGTVLGIDDLRLALSRLVVREILLPEGTDEALSALLRATGAVLTPVPAEPPPVDGALPPALGAAAAAILDYLGRTHPALLATVQPMVSLSVADTLVLPPSTVRNLELLTTFATGRARGSVLHFLDRTRTPMGGRLLRDRLLAPLTDKAAIDARLDEVASLVAHPVARAAVREALTGVGDVERLLTRLAAGTSSARDLNGLSRAVAGMQAAATALEADLPGTSLASIPDCLPAFAIEITATFVPDPPQVTREGGMVRPGVNAELDEARDLAENGKQYIAEFEATQRERTGIPTLKVRYNRVFGYLIEVTRSYLSRVPDDYQRRQTLAGAERFLTPELDRLERQVTSAEERSRALESEIHDAFRQRALDLRAAFQALAASLARLDVVASLAEVAHVHGFCRPVILADRRLRIVQGRHPIVEDSLPPGTFVPNDYDMDGATVSLDILTGPNMAGKSTVMRQVALTAILAQAGSFVPAAKAEIGIADAVFTRVGAMDDLASGRSTFMVEMSETAEVLSRATERSLVVLDEIGRGTSTFDGMAIAWAVAEYIQANIGCRTLFATHYHELTGLGRTLARTRNLSIAVKEWGGEVLFLRKLVEGPASKSYGIQVARLAGLPGAVVSRAREVLANLEAGELDATGRPTLARGRPGGRARPADNQLDLFGSRPPDRPDPVVERLAALDPDRIAPIEALQILHDLVAAAKTRVRT